MFSGGVESSSTSLIEGLRRLGVEVHAINLTAAVDHAERTTEGTVTYHRIPTSVRGKTSTLYAGDRRALRRVFAEVEPDIVHGLDSAMYGYICLRTAGDRPVVITIHGILAEELRHITETRARLRTALTVRIAEQYCVRNGRYFIQSTPYPAQYFKRSIKGMVVDTANPIPDSFFDANSDPTSATVLYAGAIIRRKRLLDLLDAVTILRRSIPSIVLRVAGGRPDPRYAREVDSFIAQHRLQANVQLLGQLSGRDLAGEYGRCSVFALPSAQETSPLAIGEAMAAGRPVVATRAGGIPYLVDDKVTGHVVDVGDVAALAARLEAVLSDSDRRAAMGAAARQKAESFRVEVVAGKVKKLYELALGNSRR
jgi:glycosyltransferase involved in cell wall biosynthesis